MKLWKVVSDLEQSLKSIQQEAEGIEGQLYQVMRKVGENILSISQEVVKLSAQPKKGAEELFKEVGDNLVDFKEVIDLINESDYKELRLKGIFEEVDEIVAGLDNNIEDLNELYEEDNILLHYIEEWDIDFFMDNM